MLFYFTTASSLLVFMVPIIGLAAGSFRNNANLNLGISIIVLSIVFGLYNVACSYLPLIRNRKNMFIIGAILGVLMPAIGTYYNIPQRVYGLPANYKYIVFLLGPVFYGLIWMLILQPIENRIIHHCKSLKS